MGAWQESVAASPPMYRIGCGPALNSLRTARRQGDRPEESDTPKRGVAHAVHVSSELTVPDTEETALGELLEDDTTALEELLFTDLEPYEAHHRHRLLGWPELVQWHPMQEDCELAAAGVDPTSDEASKRRAHGSIPGAARWRLLAQFDSDSDLGWEWGDTGRVYFWIRDEDLRHGRFDQAWACMQCT